MADLKLVIEEGKLGYTYTSKDGKKHTRFVSGKALETMTVARFRAHVLQTISEIDGVWSSGKS
jgi:hypothetical protein